MHKRFNGEPLGKGMSMWTMRAGDDVVLIQRGTNSHSDRFQVATPAEQSLLLALARESGAASLATIRTRLLGSPGAAELASRLIDRGLLYRHGRGSYDFALPLFRTYLRRQAEITGITTSVISSRGNL